MEELGTPSRLTHGGRFVEFTACGTYYYRLGKQLPDGRTVWLEFSNSHGDLTGKNMVAALRTQRKLEYAVAAARYWRGEAMHARAMNVGQWMLSMGAGLSAYFVGDVLNRIVGKDIIPCLRQREKQE